MKDAVTAPAIEVENLSIRYGNVTAVESVSFSVDAGEQLTLLGPSGCGKTSTLRAVAGLEKPSGGAIRIGGRTMYDGASGINMPAEQRGMSMVFQSYAIWPHMTVFDNVAYGLRVRNESGAALKEKVHHALDLVKMGAYAERNASQLSGGQQQRVALARAFAFSPTVLLFDEPLSNLDAKLRSEMRIELRELQRRLRRDLALCHARSRGGAGDVRPDRRHALRQHRAERHAGRDLQLSRAPHSSPTSSARPTSSAAACCRSDRSTAASPSGSMAATSSSASATADRRRRSRRCRCAPSICG